MSRDFHRSVTYNTRRHRLPSPHRYGRRWRRKRIWFLNRNPLCVACVEKGLTTGASEVDHLVPVRDGGSDEVENLQALCKPCHSRKTMLEVKRMMR